jgi:predicted membrane protein
VLLQVLSAIINNDLQGLVDSRPLKAWKETLALIFTVCIFFSSPPGLFQTENATQMTYFLIVPLLLGYCTSFMHV